MADQDSIYCPSCQRHTNLINRARYNVNSSLLIEIGECNYCNFFLLIHRLNGKIMLLYPQSLPRPVDSRIPEVVSSDLKEALLCFSVEAHRAAAVLARRAIQVICLDKGAPKDQKLNQQIDWLFDNGVITKDLKEWAHEVRFIGNDGAHPGNLSDEAVTKNDSEDILNLVEQFAKVLYVAPAIASERKKHRESK